MLIQYDYSEQEWNSILNRYLRVNQMISIKIGLSPFSEWIVVEKNADVKGYGEDMILCRPKISPNNKNNERYFTYADITMIY